jgi:hypothetical protein
MDDMHVSAAETHEGAAFLAMIFIQITGALAFLGLWSLRRTGSLSNASSAVIFIFASVSFMLVAGAANLGGEIRHTEIRPDIESVTAIGPFARTVGNYVRDTPWTWVTSETLHFIGLTLLLSVLTLVALRMLGFVSLPPGVLMRLLPWGMVGYAINAMTGMLFFAAAPQQYYDNPAFYWKLIFLMLGGANVLYFTFDTGWKVETGRATPQLTKLLAVSALFIWVGVMYWGSMLPFIGNAF